MRRFISLLILFSLVSCLSAGLSLAKTPEEKEATKPVCKPIKEADTSKINDFDVYKGAPYSPGEMATYNVSYFGVLAGTGFLEVEEPVNHQGSLHRSFFAYGRTGDWYRGIFRGEDFVRALVRPFSGAIAQFYVEQDEQKIFKKPFRQKKWLDYNHSTCEVTEKRLREGEKKERIRKYSMISGSTDILGVVYWLREQDFSSMKPIKRLVYSSEESWWLEATPIAIEEVKVPAGKFKAVKLKLITFIGDKFQQKGDIIAWIDVEGPNRALVQAKGEIKIGSLWVELTEYKLGKAAITSNTKK